MEETKLPHKLTLTERKILTLTGVAEVVSFEDTAVVLRTSLGNLVIHGRDLQLKALSLEGGQAAVEGLITAMVYEEARPSGGFLRRLLG